MTEQKVQRNLSCSNLEFLADKKRIRASLLLSTTRVTQPPERFVLINWQIPGFLVSNLIRNTDYVLHIFDENSMASYCPIFHYCVSSYAV